MSGEAELWQGARIGVFGGTFDPPHSGHIRMATHARATLALDRVLFSVAPRPPHKDIESTVALHHRVEMVRLAIEGAEGVHLTLVEQAHEVSFTVDLLRACRERTTADLYFLMGADSLAELSTWKEPEEIVRLATLVVFPRDGLPARLDVSGPAGVIVFESPRIDVSSTDVRRLLAAGAPVESLAPAVLEYARRHRLYGA